MSWYIDTSVVEKDFDSNEWKFRHTDSCGTYLKGIVDRASGTLPSDLCSPSNPTKEVIDAFGNEIEGCSAAYYTAESIYAGCEKAISLFESSLRKKWEIESLMNTLDYAKLNPEEKNNVLDELNEANERLEFDRERAELMTGLCGHLNLTTKFGTTWVSFIVE